MKTFGKILKKKRKAKHLAQWELGEELEVSQQIISTWEHELEHPSFENLIKLADFFECSLDELVGREGY